MNNIMSQLFIIYEYYESVINYIYIYIYYNESVIHHIYYNESVIYHT